MNFVGIDLHKKTISICVVDKERTVVDRKRFYCSEPERIAGFFKGLVLRQRCFDGSPPDMPKPTTDAPSKPICPPGAGLGVAPTIGELVK